MMPPYFIRFFISAALYFAVCLGATWLISPQSLLNFVGPAAALVSGLLLVWGGTALFAILLTSPLVALSLGYYFGLDANLAVMSIAVLAITLQGFWTKQLVFNYIHYKKWIMSRKHLFFFLLRVGPVASLASASAALIIAMLDNQVTQGTFLYTFISTWSSSMVMAVFFIPLLLLARNAEQVKLTKRLFVIFTSVLGGLAILLLLKTSQHEQQHYRQELFEQSKAEIERLISKEVDAVVNQINSLSALFKASKQVSLVEFNLFSASIFKEGSSVRALEWAPIVPLAQRKSFEQAGATALQQDFTITERLKTGQLVLAKQRSHYAPLQYVYPKLGNQAVLGLDVYTNPKHILSMQQVIDEGGIVASAPITLIQDELAKPGMLFSTAIFSMPQGSKSSVASAAKKMSLIQEEQLQGFVVAVIQFERFFQRLANQKAHQVNFFIQDISSFEPFTLFGQSPPTANRHAESIEMQIFSRVWQLTIVEKKSWFAQPKSWQSWAALIGGTLGAVLFQMLVLMMAAYSSELSMQVEIKTRALISAKENSEQKSLAKSHFLQTLNKELRIPLRAIKAFVEQLKQKDVNNIQVTGISHAGDNVALLLDTMMDLSDIESGMVVTKQDCFDFHGFLQRTETVLKASTAYEGKSIFFIIDKTVPHYLNSDELYIQKLLNALIESAHQLLKTDVLRLSIKLHKHKLADSSLFFTLSSQNAIIDGENTSPSSSQFQSELSTDSTAMAMAIQYSQLLRGDANLGTLSSGAGVLNASIRVSISSLEEQEAQQGLTFDLTS